MSSLDRISPLELGSRLRIARNAARITQEEAARAIGVGRTTIVAIEGGERPARPAELTKLAELYGVSVNSLLRKSAVHVDLVPQFRKVLAASKGDEADSLEAAATLQRLASLSVELERLVNKKWNAINFPEYQISRFGWQEQAEDLAAEIRQRLGVGSAPIADIFVLIEDMGIRLFVQRIPSKISGLFAYQEEIGGCILLNALHPPERRMWTGAHEIGHFLTNRRTPNVTWAQDRPGDERFANRFAAAFLMPASLLRLRYSEVNDTKGKFSPKDLVFLARTLNVSIEAMSRRLEQLGLLAKGTYDALCAGGFSVRAADKLLGTSSKGESFVPKLTWLALEAYERGFLTEGQVADFLNLDRLSVRRLAATLLGESFREGDPVHD